MAKPILARFGEKILFGGDGLPVFATAQAPEWDGAVPVNAE
jgi:hypothetical protein